MIKKENGVTLIALTILIIIMGIIAGISIYSGKQTIKEAKLESLKTNMMLIEAKAKEYVEEANFKLGPNFDSTNAENATKLEEVKKAVYIDEAKLEKATTAPNGLPTDTDLYRLTDEAMRSMGIRKNR